MAQVAYITQGDNIVLTVDGENYVVNESTHLNYNEIREAIENEDWDSLVDLVDVRRSIASLYDGEVQIMNGFVEVKGKRLHDSLSERLLEMYRRKLPLNALAKFLVNLADNPSRTAVNELYEFLEANTLPLTPDGHFMAYKRVHKNEDGTMVDCYSGTVSNNVGDTPSMDRNDVDDDRRNTCSEGLHFCSLEYLQRSGYGGYHNPIVLIKINPKDVVSIPPDYNNSKGRCSDYEVVGVHFAGEQVEAFDSPVYDDEEYDYVYDEEYAEKD